MNESGTLVSPACFPALAAADLTSILARWEEPHRRWHGPGHLLGLLATIEAASELGDADRELLRYVALFHDAIYDPLAQDNEEKSAELARQLLAHYPRLEEVAALILATKTHCGDDPLAQRFNQWDCAILSEQSWGRLRSYEEGIAHEYRAVDPVVYRRERSRFLRGAARDYTNPLLDKLADEVERG